MLCFFFAVCVCLCLAKGEPRKQWLAEVVGGCCNPEWLPSPRDHAQEDVIHSHLLSKTLWPVVGYGDEVMCRFCHLVDVLKAVIAPYCATCSVKPSTESDSIAAARQQHLAHSCSIFCGYKVLPADLAVIP